MSRNAASTSKRLSPGIVMLSAKLVAFYIAFLVIIVLLTIWARHVLDPYIVKFDEEVFDHLSNYLSQRNTGIMEVFTFLGSHKFLIPAFLLLFAYYCFIRKDKWYSIRIAILSVTNLLLLFVFKFIFDRSRPLNPLFGEVPGLSFPSGHAMMSVIFFGLLINIICREVKNTWIRCICSIILLMVILLVGLSRVYLRLHYASDIIAGYSFGLLSFLMLLWMLNKVEKASAKKVGTGAV